MLKQIAVVDGYRVLRDDKNGIAYADNGRGETGAAHASIDATGSVRGMKKNGGWRKSDRIVVGNGAKTNIDRFVVTCRADEIAAEYCQCAACCERRCVENRGF